MSRLRPDSSFLQTTRALAVAVRRLEGRRETRALAASLRERVDQATAADASWRQAQINRSAAVAEVRYLDQEVAAAIMATARAALAQVGGRRADPRYRELFPEAPSTSIRSAAGRDRAVRRVQALVNSLPEHAGLAAHAEALETLQFSRWTALGLRDALLEVEAAVTQERARAVDAARRAFNGLQEALEAALPGRAVLIRSFSAG